MIEKCSIGNMSYNIQNITLIILILILIIVIIYYLRNSSTKHNELIEKYTTGSSKSTPEPTIKNTDINTVSYTSHTNVTDSVKNSQFPTDGTVVTLRPCQVQFNNTFDADGTGTHKYVYEDGWQEIATLKETSDSSPIKITNKIISSKNETNKNDVNAEGVNDFVNYSEHSKCFKKISGSDNKYRYQGNNLIKYSTGNHVELKLDANGVSEKYIQMEFDLLPENSSTYYDNLKNSICSLKYGDTVSGLSGKLIRLTLNADNTINEIKRVNIDSANNHIFNIDQTFDISTLITSGNSGTYNYNNNIYEYITTNSATSGLITIINLYQFDRNLLCDKTSAAGTTYQNIKTYKKLNNAKIDVSKLIDFNLPPNKLIQNTTLPSRYINDRTIKGNGFAKDTLLSNFDKLINYELIVVNKDINNNIVTLTNEKGSLETVRNTFISNNPKQTFINNAIIKSNYHDSSLNYRNLINENNYDIIVGAVEYYSHALEVGNTSIKMTGDKEPTVKEVLAAGEKEVYEIMVYTHDGRSEAQTPYELTFDEETVCDILIVAGGGGGGMDMGGGGGGGGLFEGKQVKIAKGKHNIMVGKGGNGAPAGGKGSQGDHHEFTINATQGANSSFDHKVAIGGGYGGSSYQDHRLRGKGGDGGSGGGGSGYCWSSDPSKAGKGIEGQGNNGGYGAGAWYGAGGGGAGHPGGGPSTAAGGAYGGEGKKSDILGIEYYWAGGGGGAGYSTSGGNGGLGGGGGGAVGVTVGGDGYFKGSPGGGGCTGCWSQTRGGDGAPHTGGGGGGGAHYNRTNDGGNGGSGIVIVRFKKFAKMQDDNNSKILTLHNDPFKNDENTITRIFTSSGSITLNPNTQADVLIVGGGGGGARNDGAEGGGGGGGGAVIHTKLIMPDSSREISVEIGNGGGQNSQGNPSSITYRNNSENQIKLIAEGGGTGGGSYAGCGWQGGTGKPGGSGGGGSGYCGDFDGGASTGIKDKTQIPNLDSSITSYTYYGNKGGFGHNIAGGAGGGGAREPGNSTNNRFHDYWPVRQNTSGRGGGSGINIPIFNTNYYGAGGAGSISYHGGREQEWHGGNFVRGGYGGGGNAALRGHNAENGLPNTGSGGGGSSVALAGSGGSGIVIVRYTNDKTKVFRLRFPTKTYVKILGGNNDASQFFHGTYKVSITPSVTTLSIDTDFPITGVTTLPLETKKFRTNKIHFIYNLFKSIEDVNSSDVSIPSKTNLTTAYLNNMAVNGGPGIPFLNSKYNRYIIKTHITKTYKTGANSVNFNIVLYTTDGSLIPSDNYSIRYVFPETSSNNVIIPIDIYLSIKPITNIAGTKFIAKTYMKTSQGLNDAEIYAFLSNKITQFNNIVNWDISLTEKDVWGIASKNQDIIILENSRVTLQNINDKCNNPSSYHDASHVCDINTLKIVKNIINTTAVSSGSPNIKPGVSISSTELFPLSTNVNPILDYSITDYISYESSTKKVPSDRNTQFNILDSASKYVYFAIPSASS
jgi:hypothetical protein